MMEQHDPTKIEDASLYEHYDLRHRDPLGEVKSLPLLNQMTPVLLIFTLPWVAGEATCFSGDYGHWDEYP